MGNRFKQIEAPPVGEALVSYDVEQLGLDGGVRQDVDPASIPLGSSPDVADVRFEGDAIRKDFGYQSVGDPAVSSILGIFEHRYYDSGGNEHTNLVRIIRQADGEAQAELWDSEDWDLVGDSSGGGETIIDGLVSGTSTLGEFFIAGGEDDILYLDVTPSLTTREDDFAADLDLDEAGDSADVALANEPSFDHNYTVSYEVEIFFKHDGVGEGGLVRLEVLIWMRPDAGSWTQVDSSQYALWCEDSGSGCTSNWNGTGAVRKTIFAAGFDLTDVGEVRVELDSVTEENATEVAIRVKPCRKAQDSFAGVEYQTDAPSAALTTVGTDSPHAKFIFPFADRLVALGDATDLVDGLQTASWCESGIAISATNDAWTNDGSGLVVLQDTQGDPVNELMAGVALGAEVGALFRRRSIMRIWRTGNIAQAIGFGSWHENVGTESPFSVKPVRGGAMFLGSDLMVYHMQPSGALTPIGRPIHEKLIDDVTSNLDLVYADYDHIFEDYILAIPVDGESELSEKWVFSLNDFLDSQELKWTHGTFTNPIRCLAIAGSFSEV